MTESEPGNSNEDTRENQVIMKLPPVSTQNPSQAEITISKKVPNESNERGLIDLVDNFFDVQVSLEDPNAAQNFVEANKGDILDRVVEMNNSRLDQIIQTMTGGRGEENEENLQLMRELKSEISTLVQGLQGQSAKE